MPPPVPPRPPPRLAYLWYGLSGGLCGGSLVGVCEAAWLLSSVTSAEYQALIFGALLYGAAGAASGVVLGGVFALVGRALDIGAAFAWCLAFFAVATAFGAVIARHLVAQVIYREAGMPAGASLAVVGGLVALAALGTWIGTNLLTKTPLRVVPGVKGTAVGWGGGAALMLLFSLAPAPGAAGVRVPGRPQTDEVLARPDIVVVLVDALRADALGIGGAGPGASPALDAFAGEAVVFEQHIAAASWTRASIASIFTSLPPGDHGCVGKHGTLEADVETLAEALRSNGYATAGFPNNGNVSAVFGLGQGFDWYPFVPRYPFGARESSAGLALYRGARKALSRAGRPLVREEHYRSAAEQFGDAEAFLDDQRGDRSFVFVHLMEPHDPYFSHPDDGKAIGRSVEPSPSREQVEELRERYAGEVREMDGELGRFFDRLRARGRYDDALIVVTSDHGEEFLDHGAWWHGTSLFDEQIRVPLLIKLPGGVHGGVRVPWQVRSIDVAPTILDHIGSAPVAGWQGVPLFDAHFEAAAPVSAVGPEEATGGVVAPPRAWDSHPASRDAYSEQDFDGYAIRSLRADGLKLIETTRVPDGNPRVFPRALCFDLRRDPREQHNLTGAGSDCEAALGPRLHGESAGRRPEVGAGGPLAPALRAHLDGLGYGPELSSP